MNLPAELRDELLSGYLDGELSPDEKARVERMLERDEDARRMLVQLRELGREVRAASAGARLDEGFAERVWAATVAEAGRQDLPEEHPVLRAEKRNGRRAGAVRLADRRPVVWGGALSALAASLLLVAVLWNRGGDDRPLDRLADTNLPVQGDGANGVDGANEVNGQSRIAAVDRSDTETATDAAAATEGGDERSLAGDAGVPESVRPEESPQPERIAAADLMETGDDGPLGPEAVDDLADALGAEQGPGFVLVLDLVLSALGLEQDVLGSELERIGLGKPAPMAVDQAVLNGLRAQQLVGDTAGAAEAGAQIFLLEGSAKRLDRLMVRLAQPDIRPMVAAAQMTMLQDASWLRPLVASEDVDASAVRHAESRERAIQLVFEDNDVATPDGWFGRGGDLGGADLRESPLSGVLSQADNGPDFVTQTLIRVRVER